MFEPHANLSGGNIAPVQRSILVNIGFLSTLQYLELRAD